MVLCSSTAQDLTTHALFIFYAIKMHSAHVPYTGSLVPATISLRDGGGRLVTSNVLGRWQLVHPLYPSLSHQVTAWRLLGVLTCGPGCCMPYRYLDIISYYPWVRHTLHNFNWFTFAKITNHNFQLRTDNGSYQTFQNYNGEEIFAYRNMFMMHSDNTQCQFLTYNLTNLEDVHLYRITLELVKNFAAAAEMLLHHQCYGPPCYICQRSLFHAAIFMMCSVKCSFEQYGGYSEHMRLLDNKEWKWEGGRFYEEFFSTCDEYRDQSYMIPYGYPRLLAWIPHIHTTTAFDNSGWSSTTPELKMEAGDAEEAIDVTSLICPD